MIIILLILIRQRNLSVIKNFLKGGDPSLFDGHNLPHHIATRAGHADVLEVLLTHFERSSKYKNLLNAFTNVDPASNALTYQNSLHLASLYGHKECLQILQKHKAKHMPNGMHQYPAMLAAFKMHIGCLKLLLHEIKESWIESSHNNLQSSDGHYSALHHLCMKTHKTNNKTIACACLLLNSGLIDINQCDEDWNVPTCLFLAARNGAVGLVHFLLNSGAEPRLCGSLSNFTLNNPNVKRCEEMIDNAKYVPKRLSLICKLEIRSLFLDNNKLDKISELGLPNILIDNINHGHCRGIVECGKDT